MDEKTREDAITLKIKLLQEKSRNIERRHKLAEEDKRSAMQFVIITTSVKPHQLFYLSYAVVFISVEVFDDTSLKILNYLKLYYYVCYNYIFNWFRTSHIVTIYKKSLAYFVSVLLKCQSLII